MTEPLRWGVIRTGGIARTFAADLQFTDSGTVVAVGRRILPRSANGSFLAHFGRPESNWGTRASGREYALRERRLAGTFATPERRCRRSELDLLRQAQRIIDLDSEIADRALDLRMSEKKLERLIERAPDRSRPLRLSEPCPRPARSDDSPIRAHSGRLDRG